MDIDYIPFDSYNKDENNDENNDESFVVKMRARRTKKIEEEDKYIESKILEFTSKPVYNDKLLEIETNKIVKALESSDNRCKFTNFALDFFSTASYESFKHFKEFATVINQIKSVKNISVIEKAYHTHVQNTYNLLIDSISKRIGISKRNSKDYESAKTSNKPSEGIYLLRRDNNKYHITFWW